MANPPASYVTLEGLMDLVGSESIEIVNAPETLDKPVYATVILDTLRPESARPGDLLLAIGLRAGDPALRQAFLIAAEVGAIIACKVEDGEQLGELQGHARAAGVVAVAVAADMSWDRLHSILRTAIALSPGRLTEPVVTLPAGDLFALANSASTLLEGPVIIDDERMNVIAFSNLEGPIDELHRQTILGRRPPREFIDWCRATGVLSRVHESRGPVMVSPVDADERLVIAVRAKSEVLGYIWVSQSGRPFDLNAIDQLTEIARMAALQILRQRANENVDRRVLSDLFRNALAGRGHANSLASRTGIKPDDLVRLISFRGASSEGMDIFQRLSVEDFIGLRLDSENRPGAVTSIGSAVFVMLRDPRDGVMSDGRALADEIIARCERQLGLPLQAIISESLRGLDHIDFGRQSVERLMAIVSRTSSRRIVTQEELRAKTVLAELIEVMADREHLLIGGVSLLAELDRDKGSDYLSTLGVYFDCGGDLTTAAKRLFLHRNSLKYRLGRIRELSGLDLDDPVEKLVAALQVRALIKVMPVPLPLDSHSEADPDPDGNVLPFGRAN